jgi:hypothetical protein
MNRLHIHCPFYLNDSKPYPKDNRADIYLCKIFTKKNQSTCFGHVIRRAGFENTIIIGKIDRKRGRGRPRENILDGMARLLGRKPKELISDTGDENKWIAMIAHNDRQGTR